MLSFSSFITEQSGANSYGALMAMLPYEDNKPFNDWIDREINLDKLGEHGIERESHVTVLYGLEDIDPLALRLFIEEYGPIEIRLGKVSKFPGDVIKIDIHSPHIIKINEDLRKTFEHNITTREGKLKAHLTLAYVRKGSHDHLIGRGDFRGMSFMIDKLTYSTKDKKKHIIELKTLQ